jgi:hypothetical protein
MAYDEIITPTQPSSLSTTQAQAPTATADFPFKESAESLIANSCNDYVVREIWSATGGFVKPDKSGFGVKAVLNDIHRKLQVAPAKPNEDAAALLHESSTAILPILCKYTNTPHEDLSKSGQFQALQKTPLGQYSQSSAHLLLFAIMTTPLAPIIEENFSCIADNHNEMLLLQNDVHAFLITNFVVTVRHLEVNNIFNNIFLGSIAAKFELEKNKGTRFIDEVGFSNPLLPVLFEANKETLEIAKLLMKETKWAEKKIQESGYGEMLLMLEKMNQPHLTSILNYFRETFKRLNGAVLFTMRREIKSSERDDRCERLREIFIAYRQITELFVLLLLQMKQLTTTGEDRQLLNRVSEFENCMLRLQSTLETIRTSPRSEERLVPLESAIKFIFETIASINGVKSEACTQILSSVQIAEIEIKSKIKDLQSKDYSPTCELILSALGKVFKNLHFITDLNPEIPAENFQYQFKQISAFFQKIRQLLDKILQCLPELDKFFQKNEGEAPKECKECAEALTSILQMILNFADSKKMLTHLNHKMLANVLEAITFLSIDDGVDCKNAWTFTASLGINIADVDRKYFIEPIKMLAMNLEQAIVDNKTGAAKNLTHALKASGFLVNPMFFKRIWDEQMKEPFFEKLNEHLKNPQNEAAYAVYETILNDPTFVGTGKERADIVKQLEKSQLMRMRNKMQQERARQQEARPHSPAGTGLFAKLFGSGGGGNQRSETPKPSAPTAVDHKEENQGSEAPKPGTPKLGAFGATE